MKRTYNDVTTTNAKFFTGVEVEHTPAFGLKTLFVVGNQTIDSINLYLTEDIEHIFFGANHSFNPRTPGAWLDWPHIIEYYLKTGKKCSLDIPYTVLNEFNVKTDLCSYENFIPQIRMPIANIDKWNSNTMIKIDDVTFEATNPGIWTHSLQSLQNPDVFTSWDAYNEDKLL